MNLQAAANPAPPDAAAVAALRAAISGGLLVPGDADYDAARAVWNAMIDRRPAVIARCRNAADVAGAIRFARAHALGVAVRGGGHNVAGYAVCDGGLVIDLSRMTGVRVAPALDRAFVEGGATWADVDGATTPFGRATPSGLVSATGVAGLTLSGGIGWLRGSHGLSCDNLIGADLVTAEGDLIHASETDHPDLFWALRGGGGNFGVVTGFEFRLHPVERTLFFCAPIYPEDRANEVVAHWRDFMASAPDQVSGLADFFTIPEGPAYPPETVGRRVVALMCVCDGPAAEGESLTAPLRNFGTPLLDLSGPMPYAVIQTLFDAVFPAGRDRCYWKSTYLKSLDDTVLREITAGLSGRPSEKTFASIWKFSGAMQRVGADATAFGDRSAPFMFSLDAIWSDPADDAANIGWVRQSWQAMQRHSTGRMYLNFPGLGEGDTLVADAFGARTYARLQQVKRRYDPGNVFRMNQNILPAG